MASQKKVIIAALAILIIVLGVGGMYGYIYLTEASGERSEESGVKAESNGDTKQALADYKKAAESCAPSDDRCRVNMEMKIQLMTDALESERNAKTGEPVPGQEVIDPNEKGPDDTTFVEN